MAKLTEERVREIFQEELQKKLTEFFNPDSFITYLKAIFEYQKILLDSSKRRHGG